jgi:hypothetical protein
MGVEKKRYPSGALIQYYLLGAEFYLSRRKNNQAAIAANTKSANKIS